MRLTSSQKAKSGTKLEFHPDFNEFYRINEKIILWIINHSVMAYHPSDYSLSQEDLRNHVLISLQESNFLQTYDPARMSLNSYFTRRVHVYLNHLEDKTKKRFALVARYYGQQRQFPELNSIEDMDGYTGPSSIDNIEWRTEIKDVLNRISERLSKNGRIILNMLAEGYNLSDTAETLKCTDAYISSVKSDIKDKARKIWRK